MKLKIDRFPFTPPLSPPFASFSPPFYQQSKSNSKSSNSISIHILQSATIIIFIYTMKIQLLLLVLICSALAHDEHPVSTEPHDFEKADI